MSTRQAAELEGRRARVIAAEEALQETLRSDRIKAAEAELAAARKDMRTVGGLIEQLQALVRENPAIARLEVGLEREIWNGVLNVSATTLDLDWS